VSIRPARETIADILLIAIAIAVAAIPEGLPAAVTVVLAIGMEAILKRGGLVRNLLAAETLGGTTVILTDKTGTLTKAQMRIAKIVTLESLKAKDAVLGTEREHEMRGDERDALEFALLASDAFVEYSGTSPSEEFVVRGRPVERAIVTAALDSGLEQSELLLRYPRVAFLPFESRHRMAISLNRVKGMKQHRLCVTGAPEYLLKEASAIYEAGKAERKTKALTEELERAMRAETAKGMRLIGVGYRNTTLDSFSESGDEFRSKLLKGIVFVGFLVLHDPLREDAKEAISVAERAGSRVIMATGDNPETAKAVALAAGIGGGKEIHVLTGQDIEGLSDEDLAKALRHTSIFARMLPEHKLRIVRVLKGEGEVVAMTGDGVNDAPALREATIGVALGSGTEVAKEASDLVLLNDSFAVITGAIEEGRRIVDNLRKIVVYLLATSGSEIILVVAALGVGVPVPLLPAQILWINMLSEGFMNFAFAFEPKEDDVMKRNPKLAGGRRMLSKRLFLFMGAIGLGSGAVLIGCYWFFLSVWELPLAEARTLVFAVLTLGTIATAFALKDIRSSIIRIRIFSNPYLLGSSAFALLGLWAALSFAPLRMLLSLEVVELSRSIPVFVVAILLNLLVVELLKYFLFERRSVA
jgi:Ca2+-transporting ATPase